MTEDDAIQFFTRATADAVRRMPLGEARDFLRGLLLVADMESLPELRAIYQCLHESHAQLELLAAPRVDIPRPEPAPLRGLALAEAMERHTRFCASLSGAEVAPSFEQWQRDEAAAR